tara:strand:+ start:63 stop:356 length:294 start_codon:yes stop_codon:yes gene_type:complete
MNFQPVNRHLLIKPVESKKEESQVLLPEDYKSSEARFKLCEVLKIANDCTIEINLPVFVMANTSMIEEIKMINETFHLILENYVIAIVECSGCVERP